MAFDDSDLDDGVDPGKRRAKRKPAPDEGVERFAPTLENCPVSPRGKSGRHFVFATPFGEIEQLPARDLASPAGLAALFDGDTSWLKGAFPAVDKPGGYVAIAAATWLMRVCRQRGFFDPDGDLRGPGAWRLNDGRLLLHLGDRIELRSERGSRPEVFDAGEDLAGHFYYRARPEPAPAARAAAPAQVEELFDFLHRWRFNHAQDPRVLLGWLGCAYLAGALRWRPHIWVTGDTSTGKTTLELLLRALLGSAALRMADTTKAAIAQRLRGAARPVLLDELERDVDASRQKQIVELARLASSEGQGDMSRGSPEGHVRSYVIRACFYFSGIVPSPLSPQDRTRIHMIDLNTLGRATVEDIRYVKSTVARLGAELPAALRARAVEGFWRFQENERVFEDAIAAVWLQGGRIVDQMGTLLAMSQMLLSDDVVTLAQAKAILEGFESRRDDILGRPDETEAQLCIEHLLTSSVALGRATVSIGELVAKVLNMTGDGDGVPVWSGFEHDELRRRGLAIAKIGESRDLALVVANNHGGLKTLFEGSRWNGGAWPAVLRRLPDAYATKYPIRFAGFQGRGTVIPEGVLPLDRSSQVDDRVEGRPPSSGVELPSGDVESPT